MHQKEDVVLMYIYGDVDCYIISFAIYQKEDVVLMYMLC
jgi:hypothetical protein